MNNIFQELLYEGVLANYMNDFVIPARTMEELEEQTTRFLKIVEKYNLCFKWLKCDFNMEEIPILGVVVGKDQGSKGAENANNTQRHWEFPQICQFLPMIHPQLQPYSKTIEQIKGQERMEMERRASKGIWRA